jgi:hypothetical protein
MDQSSVGHSWQVFNVRVCRSLNSDAKRLGSARASDAPLLDRTVTVGSENDEIQFTYYGNSNSNKPPQQKAAKGAPLGRGGNRQLVVSEIPRGLRKKRATNQIQHICNPEFNVVLAT